VKTAVNQPDRGSVAIVAVAVVIVVVTVLFFALRLPFGVLHLSFSVALVNFLSADLAWRHPSWGRWRAPPPARRAGLARRWASRPDHAADRERCGQRNGNHRILGSASHEPSDDTEPSAGPHKA